MVGWEIGLLFGYFNYLKLKFIFFLDMVNVNFFCVVIEILYIIELIEINYCWMYYLVCVVLNWSEIFIN